MQNTTERKRNPWLLNLFMRLGLDLTSLKVSMLPKVFEHDDMGEDSPEKRLWVDFAGTISNGFSIVIFSSSLSISVALILLKRLLLNSSNSFLLRLVLMLSNPINYDFANTSSKYAICFWSNEFWAMSPAFFSLISLVIFWSYSNLYSSSSW